MSTAIHNGRSEGFIPSSASSEAQERPSASLSTLSRRISGAVPYPPSQLSMEKFLILFFVLPYLLIVI
jgi:hypothetical protein